MKRCEALMIALLIMAALCVPAAILCNGLSDAVEREWRERPYEGTLEAFQQEHMALLNEAAAILWRHQEYYRSLLDEWDEELHFYRESYTGECREPYTQAEWAVLQRAFGEEMCSMAIISRWHTPHIQFVIPTASDGRGRLIHIPAECGEAGLAELLAAWQRIGWDNVKKTAYPNWYAAIWRESTGE